MSTHLRFSINNTSFYIYSMGCLTEGTDFPLWPPDRGLKTCHRQNWEYWYTELTCSGPDLSCGQDQIDLFLKIGLTTSNQYHLYHVEEWDGRSPIW